MSRIAVPAIESSTRTTADLYTRVKKIFGGRVPNAYAALGYLVPQSSGAVLDTQATLTLSGLSRQELETIKLLISVKTGCDVCVAAHSCPTCTVRFWT
jgi:alkylhydroperoxidase family enzyme